MARREKKQPERIDFIFCSDDYLLQINREYLDHDYYTDIISFDLSEEPGKLIGEIYISVDRIRDNARQYQTGLSQEIQRVIFHGILHLCGYEDKKPNEIDLMRKKENQYITQYRRSSST